MHFPHVSGISVPPVVGVQSRALAVLDAATWSGGRGTAGGAEPRGSRVASILESLAPGSGLQGWFLAMDGNQVTEILISSRTTRRAGGTGWNWKERSKEEEEGNASTAGLEWSLGPPLARALGLRD